MKSINIQRPFYDKSCIGCKQNDEGSRFMMFGSEAGQISYANVVKGSQPLKEDIQKMTIKKIPREDHAWKQSPAIKKSQL